MERISIFRFIHGIPVGETHSRQLKKDELKDTPKGV